jgi:predicted nucleic acid-binding protein
MRFALDTNILVYAEGLNDAARKHRALALVAALPQGDTLIPVQVLGELFAVLVKKAGRTPVQARVAITAWSDSFDTVPSSPRAMALAAELSASHGLGIWDALIIAAAAQAGCRWLLSEDLQDGFTWGGLTVCNPFGAVSNPYISSLLKQRREP